MHTACRTFIMLLAFATIGAAQAELQSVQVGGQIRIRGNGYDFPPTVPTPDPEEYYFEHRTRLNVRAEFTDDVSAFIEFDSYNVWGDRRPGRVDFRSNFVTGLDTPGAGDVDLYQAYIEIKNLWGLPVSARIGRQEVELGSEWLVGNGDALYQFTGLSFDGIRAIYSADDFNVNFLALKLSETFEDFHKGDGNFYGIYGSYTGLESWVFDAYWLFLTEDDTQAIATRTENAFSFTSRNGFVPPQTLGVAPDGSFFLINNAAEDLNIHTIGLRAAGSFGAFDLEAELAYQFGEIKFDTRGFFGKYQYDYDSFAFNFEAGYTFDTAWTPRLYLGAAYFEGGDNLDDGFIFDLFKRDDGKELGFHRLFSNWEYSVFLDDGDLTNSIIYRGGIGAKPTEKIALYLYALYFQADETVAKSEFFFWSKDNEDDLGWEVSLLGHYQYSDDLVFKAGYSRLFPGDGLTGNSIFFNGLLPSPFPENKDYNYYFWETEISF